VVHLKVCAKRNFCCSANLKVVPKKARPLEVCCLTERSFIPVFSDCQHFLWPYELKFAEENRALTGV
jgi:hypothetical protein